jgi:hypothetical protein
VEAEAKGINLAMEEYAYLTSIAASAFYFYASARLLRLHRRTSEKPELLLSISFACTGLYYLGYNAPSLFRLDPWPIAIELALEWVFVLGVFPYLVFIRSVFRPDGAWAGVLVALCSALLLVGSMMGTMEGDVFFSIDNPWFIVQWVGYTMPSTWMLVEAIISRRGAQKRLRLGLTPLLTVNRYLLLALFASFQVLACLSDLLFARDISASQTVSTLANVLLGGTEIASLIVLWLVFFPPSTYTKWIDRRASALQSSVEA